MWCESEGVIDRCKYYDNAETATPIFSSLQRSPFGYEQVQILQIPLQPLCMPLLSRNTRQIGLHFVHCALEHIGIEVCISALHILEQHRHPLRQLHIAHPRS